MKDVKIQSVLLGSDMPFSLMVMHALSKQCCHINQSGGQQYDLTEIRRELGKVTAQPRKVNLNNGSFMGGSR